MSANRQVLDVKLDSVKSASLIKRRFADLAKEWNVKRTTPQHMDGITVVGHITKETKIRQDILLALAGLIKEQTEHDAYVVMNIPKPLLKVNEKKVKRGEKGDKGRTWTYGFTEAVRFCRQNGLQMPDTAFAEAYKLCGIQYRAEIEHLFLVLRRRPATGEAAGRRTIF